MIHIKSDNPRPCMSSIIKTPIIGHIARCNKFANFCREFASVTETPPEFTSLAVAAVVLREKGLSH